MLDTSNSAPDTCFVIVLLELVTLFLATVAPDGRHIQHAIGELDEGTPLDGDVQVRDVVQHAVNEPLQVVLAQVLLQALHF